MTKETKALFFLFGATGDLAQRKLYPSLFRLFKKGLLKDHFAVIGTARRPWTHEHYREVIGTSIASLNPTDAEKEGFSSHFYYQSHDVNDSNHYQTLKIMADELDQTYQLEGNHLYYLAMAPQFFGTITSHLKSEHILSETGFNRLVIEKPFGFDYPSAEALNNEIRDVFHENEIFRIDHYLGKEMVQNISAIRFTNPIFEHLWNRDHIDNIQISFAESLGVEDRGGYYDNAGALKDMVQNHVLQVVSLLAMEPPISFTPEQIRLEKVKALKSVRIFNEKEVKENFVRGQYTSGHLGEETFKGYQEEENVRPDSQTETFVAGKLLIDNFRWQGVPFYVRTGKRLTEKGTRINIIFKPLPINIFTNVKDHDISPNVLTIYIQPTEGISLAVNGKEVGQTYHPKELKLEHRNSKELTSNSPEAYEKLLLDALNGDSTNFTHWDEVAQSWHIVDAIKAVWQNETAEIPTYSAGTMGPKEAFDLLKKSHHTWVWRPDKWYQDRNLL